MQPFTSLLVVVIAGTLESVVKIVYTQENSLAFVPIPFAIFLTFWVRCVSAPCHSLFDVTCVIPYFAKVRRKGALAVESEVTLLVTIAIDASGDSTLNRPSIAGPSEIELKLCLELARSCWWNRSSVFRVSIARK